MEVRCKPHPTCLPFLSATISISKNSESKKTKAKNDNWQIMINAAIQNQYFEAHWNAIKIN